MAMKLVLITFVFTIILALSQQDFAPCNVDILGTKECVTTADCDALESGSSGNLACFDRSLPNGEFHPVLPGDICDPNCTCYCLNQIPVQDEGGRRRRMPESTLDSEPTSASLICTLPSETGPCKGHFPRFFHNTLTGKCEQFIYGGCDGNANRFETLAECERECSNDNICSLPAETGPCKAHLPRFFYNSLTSRCEEFIYGGCGGNGNNFQTLAECESECDNDVFCSLPAETGPCKGFFPRFFHNSLTGRCEQFIYGGCGGNANRFETLDECRAECGAEDDGERRRRMQSNDAFEACNGPISGAVTECKSNRDCPIPIHEPGKLICHDRSIPDGELEALNDDDVCDPNCTCHCLLVLDPEPEPTPRSTDEFAACNGPISGSISECKSNKDCPLIIHGPLKFICHDRSIPDGELEPLSNDDVCDENCTCHCLLTQPEPAPIPQPTKSPTIITPTNGFEACNGPIIGGIKECRSNDDCPLIIHGPNKFICHDRLIPDGELEALSNDDVCDDNCTCFCLLV